MKTAAVANHQPDAELAIKSGHFVRMLQSIELLHRRFLDVLTCELGRRDKTLSSVQALILGHVHERSLSLGELQELGYYEGTNLAYNVGKLAEGGYISLVRPQWDKRSSLIELTDEGREIAQLVSQLLDDHAGSLVDLGIREEDMSLTTRTLRSIHNLWSM